MEAVRLLPVVELLLEEYCPLLLLFEVRLLEELALVPVELVSTTETMELELLLDFVFPASL